MFSSWLDQLNICHSSDSFPISAFDLSTRDSQCFISVCRVPLPVPLYLQEELFMRDSVSSKLLIRSMTGLPSQCFALGYLLRSCIINDWLKNSGTLHEEDLITCLALKFLLGRVCKLLCVSALEVHLRGSFSLFQSNFHDITNIFFAPEIRTFWIHGKAIPESPLPQTDAHYNVSVSKQGQECRALTARWSHHWINAPHFWVYLQQCALPPEFTSLPSFPLSSCPLSKLLSLMNPHYPTDVQPKFRHDFFLLCPSVAQSCFDVSIYVDIAPNC